MSPSRPRTKRNEVCSFGLMDQHCTSSMCGYTSMTKCSEFKFHAHPTDAFHSETDDSFPIVTTLGGPLDRCSRLQS